MWWPAGVVAVFDLDRTLLPGSSLLALARAMASSRLLRRRHLLAGAVRDAAFRRRGATDTDAFHARDEALRHVADLEVAQVEPLLEDVGARLAADVRPTAALLVRRNLAAGDLVVVLSASPQPLVEAVARHIGADRAVGTRGEVIGGRYTGRLDGPFCYGPGKLERLRADVGADAVDDAVAYADSVSDVPLLSSCREPVAVNPDRGLRAVATRAGWPIVRFS